MKGIHSITCAAKMHSQELPHSQGKSCKGPKSTQTATQQDHDTCFDPYLGDRRRRFSNQTSSLLPDKAGPCIAAFPFKPLSFRVNCGRVGEKAEDVTVKDEEEVDGEIY